MGNFQVFKPIRCYNSGKVDILSKEMKITDLPLISTAPNINQLSYSIFPSETKAKETGIYSEYLYGLTKAKKKGAAFGGGPHIRAFEYNGFPLVINFFAYDSSFRGGADVALGNLR